MKYILYYSNFCNHCKTLLMELSKSKIKEEMHFICIDKRIKGRNGETLIVLENGSTIPLPPNITEVPSLLMLNHGNNVLMGQKIYDFLEPKNKELQKQATQNNLEPLAFSLTEMDGMSDNYSYLDMTSEELSAKGSGGTRILHSFSLLDQNQSIETPNDEYEPNKVNEDELKDFEQRRNQEIPQPIQRM